MNGIQTISLAEFSRQYLRALDCAMDTLCAPSKAAAPLQISQNSFALQVVLGMSKTCRTGLSADRVVTLIGKVAI